MSAAAGSNGKQGSGFMSVISFWTGKSKGERKSSGRSRSSQDTLPRSYGMNRTSSERAERPKPVDMGRRNSDSGLQQPDDDHLVGRVDDDDAATRDPEARSESLAPKATVGMEGAAAAGAATTTEATATTAAMTTAETATTTRATATASATGSATASAAAEESSARRENSTLDAGYHMDQTDLELGFPAVYIINYWKQKEERKFATRMADMNEPPMDYAPHRRYMVDWISEVGEQLDLQTVTIHSAVSFLDELMILMNYSHRDWRLYAVCCLSVAAKYEEAECNMPMISELAEATELSLNTPIVTRGELELVQKLEWDVSRVTAMHFLGYYTSQGVTTREDTCQGRRLMNKVIVYMKKYVDFFANLCQQDYRFQRYRPSHIAAAAILAARRALCIMPVWRDELTALTGYTLADIVECGEELWNVYEKMFPTHKPLRTDPNAAAKKKAEQADAAAAAAYAAAASGVRSRASAAGAAPSNGSDSRVVAANRNRANGADGRAHGKSGSGSSSTANLRARSS